MAYRKQLDNSGHPLKTDDRRLLSERCSFEQGQYMADDIKMAGLVWSLTPEGWTARFQPKKSTLASLPVSSRLSLNTMTIDEYEELAARGRLSETDDVSFEFRVKPSEEQVAAATYFLENQTQVYDEVLIQLLRFCRSQFESDPCFFDELEGVDTLEKLVPLLGTFSVTVEPVSAKGVAWISLTSDCDWEVEHGTGICLWKDLVLDIGTHDTVHAGPSSEFRLLPPLEDAGRESLRMDVIRELESAMYEHSESFCDEHGFGPENVPEPQQLAAALLTGNETIAAELINRGVRLDEYPEKSGSPIFQAVHAQNVAIVERMIELGARLDMRDYQGNTPLQATEELLRDYQVSQGLQNGVLGDLGAMMQGDAPQAGGLMSMLSELQQEASKLVSEIDGKPVDLPQPSAEQMEQQELYYQQIAKDTQRAVAELEKIIELLKLHSKPT